MLAAAWRTGPQCCIARARPAQGRARRLPPAAAAARPARPRAVASPRCVPWSGWSAGSEGPSWRSPGSLQGGGEGAGGAGGRVWAGAPAANAPGRTRRLRRSPGLRPLAWERRQTPPFGVCQGLGAVAAQQRPWPRSPGAVAHCAVTLSIAAGSGAGSGRLGDKPGRCVPLGALAGLEAARTRSGRLSNALGLWVPRWPAAACRHSMGQAPAAGPVGAHCRFCRADALTAASLERASAVPGTRSAPPPAASARPPP